MNDRRAAAPTNRNLAPRGESPVFLERQSYRRRRLGDAGRLLPVLGALLFAVPLLWPADGQQAMSGAFVYVFSIWCGLIVASAILSRRLRRAQEEELAAAPDVRAAGTPSSALPGGAPGAQ